MGGIQRERTDGDFREFMDKMKEAGFEVTPEELADTVNGKGTEIRDEELEAVAGGIILDDLRVDRNCGAVIRCRAT